jgi:hypothetical protein
VAGILRVFGSAEDRFHVESRLPTNLEGTSADDVGGGSALWTVASLDDERSEPHTIQQQASHHADGATSDDEYWDFDSRHHRILQILNGFTRRENRAKAREPFW